MLILFICIIIVASFVGIGFANYRFSKFNTVFANFNAAVDKNEKIHQKVMEKLDMNDNWKDNKMTL